MAEAITFRPNADTARALELLSSDGQPVSMVIRAALIEALADDERDRAEMAQVLRDMESLRAW